MCNYFSIGVESRIGLGFDKKRTTSAFCNDLCYGWEGFKKLCCFCTSKTKKIRDVIDFVSTKDIESGNERIIFATDKSIPSEHYLHGNPVSFVVSNINSMMGGKAKFWESGKGKDMGIADPDGRVRQLSHFNFKEEVAHDDDHLEFDTVSSIIHLLFGKGRRIAQEKGPFTIHFKKGKGC